LLKYGIVFAVAGGVTYLLVPVVRRLAVRFGAVVYPDERRVHTSPTPTLGGGAMFVAFLAAMAVASQMSGFKPVFEGSSEPWGVMIAALVIFGTGFLDDVREVSAPAKVAGQVLAACTLGLAGVTMFYFRVPFADFVVLSPDLGFLVTVLWVVGMANAVNLIDGLDGLAAGVIAIAALAFFLYANRLSDAGLLAPDNIGPLIATIACGVSVGFLPHNVHPAKIFMGDAGAMLLGLLMASTTLVVGGRTADQFSGQTYFFFAPLIIPFFILGVPLLDTAFAIVRRAARRTALSQADKEHLHHRLMRLGHGQRRSVVILWAWTAVLSGVVLFPTYTNRGNAIVPAAVAGLGVALFTLFHPVVRRNGRAPAVERLDGERAPPPPGDGTTPRKPSDVRPPAALP
jgi:UDP-GlcNAc:undecaprenyl-phosphate/decaprenyl-phosphate GlcNAc-1-phosphate transferase